MTSHLLSLAALHAAAPGVLDVVACFDGDFPDAPIFHPPLWDGRRWVWDYRWSDQPIEGLALDLRIPTVAARLAGLCERAADSETYRAHVALLISALRAPAGAWFDDDAARLAALTLALAPRIAALGGAR